MVFRSWLSIGICARWVLLTFRTSIFQRLFIFIGLPALIVGYLVVATHTPLTIYPGAMHDDGLFIKLGMYLAEGQWLGPFSQFTLMKGPGYPAFLAVAHWLGISVTLAHALFHCLAVTVFTVVLHRFVKSYLLSGLNFCPSALPPGHAYPHICCGYFADRFTTVRCY